MNSRADTSIGPPISRCATWTPHWRSLRGKAARSSTEPTADAGDSALVKDPQGGGVLARRESERGHRRGAGSPRVRPLARHVERGSRVRCPGAFLKPWTFLALAAVYAAVLFDWTWMWGVLFLMWLVPDIRHRSTHLVEPIRRGREPSLVLGDRRHMAVDVRLSDFSRRVLVSCHMKHVRSDRAKPPGATGAARRAEQVPRRPTRNKFRGYGWVAPRSSPEFVRGSSGIDVSQTAH